MTIDGSMYETVQKYQAVMCKEIFVAFETCFISSGRYQLQGDSIETAIMCKTGFWVSK